MADWAEATVVERRRADDGLALVVHTVVEGWMLILTGAAVGLLGAVLVLRLIPPEHTARMVVGPTSMFGAAAMGTRVPVLSRVAIGAAEPGSREEALSDYARFLHLITSVAVAEQLLTEPGMVQGLFPDRWDAETGRWRPATGPVAMFKRAVLAVVGRDDWIVPDAHALSRLLGRSLVVETLGTTPMRRLQFRHRDPVFATMVLDRLVRITDTHLRQEAARRLATQIEHVHSGLDAVTVAEHRNALIDLAADQERVLLMLAVDLPFAADRVEPPDAAPLPDWPDVPGILIGFTAAGLSAGLLAAGVRTARRRRWGRPT